MADHRWVLGGAAAAWNGAVIALSGWDATSTAVVVGLMGGIIGCIAGLWPVISTARDKAEAIRRGLAVQDSEQRLKDAKAEWDRKCREMQEDMDRQRKDKEEEIARVRRECAQERDRIESELRQVEMRETRWRTKYELATGSKSSDPDSTPTPQPSGNS